MTISNLTVVALDELDDAAIAELTPTALETLQKEIDEQSALWKKRNDKLQAGLHAKYNERATAERHKKGNDTGTINLTDVDRIVKCELSKKVEWDQEVLAAIRVRISNAGQNPDVYMTPEYKIAEAAYATWPADERAEFAKGRTVKPQKPKYTILPKKDGK